MLTELFAEAVVAKWLFALLRTSGIIFFAPIFGNEAVPLQVRAAFTLLVTALLGPTLDNVSIPVPATLFGFVGIAVAELLIGMAIGFVARAFFAAFLFGAQLMDFQVGFAMVNILDPELGTQVSLLAVVTNIMAILLFLAGNGHHWFLMAARDSFALLPIGEAHIGAGVMELLIRVGGSIFALGLQVSSPILVVLILLDLAMGLIARTVPQIQILIVGFPLKIGGGMIVFSMSLAAFSAVMKSGFRQILEQIGETLRLLAF
ncbi:MAG: flagellar biosynthetic protein FliR [Candidatus Schekmanbacteria bacterium]|nr:flagellar biosynthetic protein FliR [Candidatus Schekmanbacteria bacterium]